LKHIIKKIWMNYYQKNLKSV